MSNDLMNLLPAERQKAFSREYLLRLGVVIALFLTALALAAMVLLLPTYVFLSGSAQTKQARLATIDASFFSTDGAALSARLSALSAHAATITALANAPSASAVIRAALDIPRPGVVLSGFSYDPSAGAEGRTLAISGTALTRDALRAYQLALGAVSFARSADLPVSAYAKDSNISFTITVTLKP
ncbi:MAG: hypothetical protein KGH56_03345 [Patescibacteria group bacterium]|nr:hypothetical protein [Patescibacteria group bacterium]